MNATVSTVMMATLVVGPFYLSRGLALSHGEVGLIMSVGPVISALSGWPAGRLVDRFGASRLVVAAIAGMTAGSVALAATPASLGMAGYLVGIVVLTPSYALFQAANNTAVMLDVAPDQRGVISGMLNLSRNLGLITGASLMGAVFAFASHAVDIADASPGAIATGMHACFGLAAAFLAVMLFVAIARRVSVRVATSIIKVLEQQTWWS